MGFRAVELSRQQMVLWSQSLDDAVAADHPVRLFDRILRGEAFEEFFRGCRREYVLVDGRPAYEPRDVVALYLYGMLHGIRSSRRLEGACHNRIDVMWLMQGQTPDHSTIAGFVARHGGRLRELFRQSIRVAVSAGLVKLKHVSADGTKLEADAGRGSVKARAKLEAEKAKLEAEKAKLEAEKAKLEEEQAKLAAEAKREAEAARSEAQVAAAAEACEAEWSQNEQKEQSLWAEQAPEPRAANGKEAEAARQRFRRKQERIDAALAAIEKRRQEAEATGGTEPKAIASGTDPEARVMPDKQGRSRPGYNAQIVVDAQAGVIVAQDVNDRPEDVGQLTPLLGQVKEMTGRLPDECSADSGYTNGSELKALEEMGVTGYLPEAGANSGSPREVPTEAQAKTAAALEAAGKGDALAPEQFAALPLDGRKKFDKSAFTYEAGTDTYRCPAGHSLPVLRHSQDHKGHGTVHRTQYGGCAACATCPHAAQCCGNPAKGRTVNRDQFEAYRERMRERMNSEEGRERYRLRKQTVEPRFGYLKHVLGIRRFMHRGLSKVRAEFSLICAAVNLKAVMGAAAGAGAATGSG
jgi:transposase